MGLVGTAKALYNQEDYKGAMKYSRLSFYAKEYDQAFEANRELMLRNNFTLIVVIVLVLIVVMIVIKQLKKRGKIPQKLIATAVGKIADGVKSAVGKIGKGGKSK